VGTTCECAAVVSPQHGNVPAECKDYSNAGYDWCFTNDKSATSSTCTASTKSNNGWWTRCYGTLSLSSDLSKVTPTDDTVASVYKFSVKATGCDKTTTFGPFSLEMMPVPVVSCD
jgi:hypothetical protein